MLQSLSLSVVRTTPGGLYRIRYAMGRQLFEDIRKAIVQLTGLQKVELSEEDFVTAMIKFGCTREESARVFQCITDSEMSWQEFAQCMASDALASHNNRAVSQAW